MFWGVFYGLQPSGAAASLQEGPICLQSSLWAPSVLVLLKKGNLFMIFVRCPLAWLGCSWASSRQAPFSRKVFSQKMVDRANDFFSSQFCLKFSRSNDSFSVAQVEPASARETNCKEERRSKQKVGRQTERESKKVVGRQKEKCSLALLPTETLHHLFSFLQVFTMVSWCHHDDRNI